MSIDNNIAAKSTLRQAQAYLELKHAEAVLSSARSELRTAEQTRLRPRDPLTVVINGKAVTSHKVGPDDEWQYTVSQVVS